MIWRIPRSAELEAGKIRFVRSANPRGLAVFVLMETSPFWLNRLILRAVPFWEKWGDCDPNHRREKTLPEMIRSKSSAGDRVKGGNASCGRSVAELLRFRRGRSESKTPQL